MSEEGDDNITVIVGDETLSQDLNQEQEEEQNPVILKIVKKQRELRDEMLKLQGKMDNQIHYKAVIKMTTSRASKEIILPTNVSSEGGKFFISSIAGRLSSGSAKYIHVESTNLSNSQIYVSENGSNGVLGTCILSNVVSQVILENGLQSVGFPIPTQLYHCPMVDLVLTDENHVPLTNVDFVEITLILICNKE